MNNENDLADLVQTQAAMIAELRERIDRLEDRASRPSLERHVSVVELEPDTSRRGFLKLAGFAAAGAAAVVVGNAQPAAATDNSAILQAQVNTGTLPTTVTNAGASGSATSGVKAIGPQESIGLYGISNGPPAVAGVFPPSLAVGVLGDSDGGFGVYGQSLRGYGLYAGGIGRIGLDVHGVTFGPSGPTGGGYQLGDIVRNVSGETFSCVVAGSGGAAKFRKLAGPSTAGQLHLFGSQPRVGNTFNTSLIGVNSRQSFSVASAAPGATAVLGTVTTYSPSAFASPFGAGGYATVIAGGGIAAGVSVTFTAGQMFMSGLFVSPVVSSTIDVLVFGSAAHVTVDLVGYYL